MIPDRIIKKCIFTYSSMTDTYFLGFFMQGYLETLHSWRYSILATKINLHDEIDSITSLHIESLKS